MVRPLGENTYENLLKHYNRDSTFMVQCECGKIVKDKCLDRHKTTKLHALLMKYKTRQTEKTDPDNNVF